MDGIELAHEGVRGPTEATRRAVFLHGILGSRANLKTIARRFVEARPGWDAWLVDLRGHGASPKRAPGPSLDAAARDVAGLMASSAVPIGAIAAHSFGGKVALAALRHGIAAPMHVVSIDSPPGPREPMRGHGSALAVIDMIEALPRTFESKAAFTEAVVAAGHPRAIAQWLAMSTEKADGGVRFALDLEEIRALVLDYFAADLWPVVESTEARVHFVIGDRSSSWSEPERERARALAAATSRVTVDVLPTDHWVHAEDPEGLLRVLLERIPS